MDRSVKRRNTTKRKSTKRTSIKRTSIKRTSTKRTSIKRTSKKRKTRKKYKNKLIGGSPGKKNVTFQVKQGVDVTEIRDDPLLAVDPTTIEKMDIKNYDLQNYILNGLIVRFFDEIDIRTAEKMVTYFHTEYKGGDNILEEYGDNLIMILTRYIELLKSGRIILLPSSANLKPKNTATLIRLRNTLVEAMTIEKADGGPTNYEEWALLHPADVTASEEQAAATQPPPGVAGTATPLTRAEQESEMAALIHGWVPPRIRMLLEEAAAAKKELQDAAARRRSAAADRLGPSIIKAKEVVESDVRGTTEEPAQDIPTEEVNIILSKIEEDWRNAKNSGNRYEVIPQILAKLDELSRIGAFKSDESIKERKDKLLHEVNFSLNITLGEKFPRGAGRQEERRIWQDYHDLWRDGESDMPAIPEGLDHSQLQKLLQELIILSRMRDEGILNEEKFTKARMAVLRGARDEGGVAK